MELLYIFFGLLVGAILGWLLGSRHKPEFNPSNKELEDELREQVRQLQETLAAIREELSENKEARTVAETAKLSSDQTLAEHRNKQQQAEKTIDEFRDKLSKTEIESANAKHLFETQKALSTSLEKERDELKVLLAKLQNEINEIKQLNGAQVEKIKSQNERLTTEAESAKQRFEVYETLGKSLSKERDDSRASAAKLQNEFNELKQQNSGQEEKIKSLNEWLDKERKQLLTLQETFKKEFEAVSNKLLLESSTQFAKQSSESLDTLLKPLKTNIDEFKLKLDTAHTAATEQTALLKDQIKNISTEAANLSKALKGDAKALGNWGENMLDTILEKSGLQKGLHYRRQQGVVNGEDQRFLDVIIDLPDNKHLVIDSKVSLKHYEAHVNSADEELRQSCLSSHADCLQAHIRGLSAKRYQDIHGINAPDFVLMYIPIEAAFIAAVNNDQSLFADALDKNVVLITNSTLLATLRTVASVWRLADQKKNHLDIADRGGKLYDKFVLFIEDLQKIGEALDSGKSFWDKAIRKLSTGSGNLVGQAEKMRKLGVKATKEMPAQILENCDKEQAVDS